MTTYTHLILTLSTFIWNWLVHAVTLSSQVVSLLLADNHMHINIKTDTKEQENDCSYRRMDFKQHVNEPTHYLGHSLQLVISYGLGLSTSTVVDSLNPLL